MLESTNDCYLGIRQGGVSCISGSLSGASGAFPTSETQKSICILCLNYNTKYSENQHFFRRPLEILLDSLELLILKTEATYR